MFVSKDNLESSVTRSRVRASEGDVMATHHDCLALVLDDVAGPANLVAAAQGQEHKLIGRVDGLIGYSCCCHGRGLPLGSHRVCV